MQRTMKRIGALILALAMLVTFMPSLGLTEQVHADDEEGITVYLTVSNKGVIAQDNDGEAMAWREVEVTDLDNDGEYTYDEALVAAHAKYNSAAGFAMKSSGWVEALWGISDNPASYSFTLNNDRTNLINTVKIADGDYLSVSINQDAELSADWASFFDTYEKIVGIDESFTLSLKGFPAMSVNEPKANAGIQIGVWKNGSFEPVADTETDENGKVSLSFDKLGKYIVSASGSTNDVVDAGDDENGLWKLVKISNTSEGKTVYGGMDWDTYDRFYAYTKDDYGDGPYPWNEIKFVDAEEYDDADDFVRAINGYPVYSGHVTADCPLIAPCCVVNVVDTKDVYVTVSNKGILASDNDGEAMVEKQVTAYDFDGDGTVTVVEALASAHEQYFSEGADGFAYTSGTSEYGPYISVTRLWGVDTWNSLYFVNGEGVSYLGNAVESDDVILASLNLDDKYYADLFTKFDDDYIYTEQKNDITVQLTGHLGMGMYPEDLTDKPLEGVQLGLWEDGAFKAIPGAVTDSEGKATFFLEEEGEHILTAQGTSKWNPIINYETSERADLDCPIIAPYCFLEVRKASSTSTFDAKKAEAFSELFDTFDPAKYRGNDQMKVLSLLVKAQSQISAANTTADIEKAVDAAKAELKKITTDAQYKKQEAAFKKMKIKGVKAKAGKKKVTVTWKKAKVSGYEIVCKAGKTKKAVIKKAATVKKVIKGLTSKKKCTTKIRGFKTIGGKKVYTAWAKAKTVKVK